ncbi:MAG TPA: hypothetical protein VIF62_05230 [Labilithrix sp.]
MGVARSLVIASATLAACSLNFDGYTGGTTPVDAGAPQPPPPPPSSMDASMSDASDASTAPSCPTDAIFCEDFESFGGWDDKDEEFGATCGITTSRAHAGTHALRAFAPAILATGPQNDQCYYSHLLPEPPPARLAMRAWMYVVSPVGSGPGWDPIQMHPAASSATCKSGSMYTGYDAMGAFATFDTGTSTMSIRAAPSAPPLALDRWTCIEYVFDAAAAGHFTMYVDDVLAIDGAATYADGDPFCGFQDLDVGIAGHATDHDLEVEWDDVVVAPHRIGCQ